MEAQLSTHALSQWLASAASDTHERMHWLMVLPTNGVGRLGAVAGRKVGVEGVCTVEETRSASVAREKTKMKIVIETRR